MNENIKLDISKKLYNLLSESEYKRNLPDFESCFKSWWLTPLATTSLRLTCDGFNAFKAADIEYYTVPYGKSTMYNIPTLSFKFAKISKCPYYIDTVKWNFLIFDTKVYLNIMLYGDSIVDYVDRKFPKRIVLNK